ncbi:MAG: transposase [Syntrophales bacterium]
MARKPRIHFPGAVYHVILRGNAGQAVFRDDQDYLRFHRLIEEGHKRYAHRIHAFCLMPNHVHLVIEVGEIPLSRIIQNLSQRYTSWFNRKNEKSGHVFQGRYKAILIDADSYLLELIRYVHLNPVRAGLTSLPEHYPWSSEQSYSEEVRHPWLTTDRLLSQFSDSRSHARKRYKKFLHEGLGESRRIEFHRGTAEGRILGNDRFLEATLEKVHQKTTKSSDIEKMIHQVCRHFEVKEKDLVETGKNQKIAKARAMLSWLVRESKNLTLTELSKRLLKDISGLSRAATLLAEKAEKDQSLKDMMEHFRRDLL